MSRIRAEDTGPELLLRRALHRAGLRYRLHDRSLPGTPDVVLRGRRAVIFVHGCFWHSHDCPYGVRPASNAEFWAAKLARNVERDAEQLAALAADAWRIAVVWECALKGRARRPIDEVADTVVEWLRGSSRAVRIAGAWPSATDRAST